MIKNIIIGILLLAFIGQKEFLERSLIQADKVIEESEVVITSHGYKMGWLDGIQFGITNEWPKAEPEHMEDLILPKRTEVSHEYLRHQENIAWELKLQALNNIGEK